MDCTTNFLLSAKKSCFVISGDVLRHCERECIGSVIVSHEVNEIGVEAFADCCRLEEVVVSDSVLFVESYAFAGCNNLKTVTFKSNRCKIGCRAFYKCHNLSAIIFESEAPALLDVHLEAFDSVDKERCRIYVLNDYLDEFVNGGLFDGFRIHPIDHLI